MVYPKEVSKKDRARMFRKMLSRADAWTDHQDFRYAKVAEVILGYFLTKGNVRALPDSIEKRFLAEVLLSEINAANPKPSPEERNALLAMFLQKHLIPKITEKFYFGWCFQREMKQKTRISKKSLGARP